MAKGIREYTNQRFSELLPKFHAGELDATAFRRQVMDNVVEHFGITVASAATHYNHSLKTQRAANAELVKNLGRPEDKKGGRKPIHTVTVIKVKTGEVVATGISRPAATLMIEKAAAKKKARLAIQEPVAVEVTA